MAVVLEQLLDPVAVADVCEAQGLGAAKQRARAVDRATRTPLRARSGTLGVVDKRVLMDHGAVHGHGRACEPGRVHASFGSHCHHSALIGLVLLESSQRAGRHEHHVVRLAPRHQRLDAALLHVGDGIHDHVVLGHKCARDAARVGHRQAGSIPHQRTLGRRRRHVSSKRQPREH